MFLKNTVARLITINAPLNADGERVEKYQVKPGNNPSVEVPDHLCKTAFVKALIASGALAEVQGDPSKPDLPEPKPKNGDDGVESLYADFDKSQLVAQCEARDIEVNSRDTKATLTVKLETADE